MPNWINFAELRARVSLEDVIVRYYKIENLKRDGNKLVGPCPIHQGDSPRAFHADLDKNVWHCFSKCQKGGNQLDFVAMKENVGIRDAALKVQAFFVGGTPPPTAPLPAISMTPRPPAKAAPTTTASAAAAGAAPAATSPSSKSDEDDGNPTLDVKLDLKSDHPHLLDERKLKEETVKRFGVGYCSRGIMRAMIAIPVHDEDGDLVAYAGRRLKPSDVREFGKYKLPKGFKKDRVLYNFHRAKHLAHSDGLILVEGFFSVMKLHEVGFENVVAPMGCELSDYQVKLLATAAEVIILFDGDEAGRKGAAAAAEKLARARRPVGEGSPVDRERDACAQSARALVRLPG